MKRDYKKKVDKGRDSDFLKWQKERKALLDTSISEYDFKKHDTGDNIKFLSSVLRGYFQIIGM